MPVALAICIPVLNFYILPLSFLSNSTFQKVFSKILHKADRNFRRKQAVLHSPVSPLRGTPRPPVRLYAAYQTAPDIRKKLFSKRAFSPLTSRTEEDIIIGQNKEERQHPFSPPAMAKGSIMENTAFGLFVSMVRVQMLRPFLFAPSSIFLNGGASVLAATCISSTRRSATARSA